MGRLLPVPAMADLPPETAARALGLVRESFITAAGPGGQNVNKVATAVQLRIDVYALRLDPPVFARLRLLAGSKLTLGGEIVFTARKFRLRQTTALADISTSAATGGLRLLMSVIAANNGILPWAGYVISALDQSHVDAAGNNIDDHKQDAHFHDTPKGFDSTPLALKGIGDNVYDLTYGLGTIVEVDELFKADNILLHERFFAGTQRVFDISLRPVPEPGTLWLAGPLLLLLLHGRRRLQRAPA